MSTKPCKVWQWKELLTGIIIAIAASTVLEVKIHICFCRIEALVLRYLQVLESRSTDCEETYTD